MTSLRLVDTDTGEVVDLLTAEEARELTDGIRDQLEIVWSDVVKAYERQAWRALGYDSWDFYTHTEFSAGRLRLPLEERREVVASLADAGLSTRAIAAVTGTSQTQARRDRQVSQKGSPESRDRGEVEPRFGNKVKGLDGKQYTRPEPKPAPAPPRRTSLVEVATKAGWDFRKATERLERIRDDDRFGAHKAQVAAQLSGHLRHAVEVCQDLLDRLDHDEGAS